MDNDVIKIIGGAVGGLGVIACIWRSFNGRLDRQKLRLDNLAENIVIPQVCEERHRRIDEKLDEHGMKLDRIEQLIHELPRRLNGQ